MKHVLPALFLLLACSACSIEDRIERREDRLLGTWEIDRASYRDADDLFADNVTGEFSGDYLIFYPDYSVIYETGDGRIYDGYWVINAITDLDDETEFTFDADFFDARGRLAFQWLGTIDKLNRNRFRVSIYDRGGLLRLRWSKR